MRIYRNSTIRRLEGYARARGDNVRIIIDTDNISGKYFALKGKPVSLGFTVNEAKKSLSEGSWKFVVAEYAKGRI